MEAKEGLYCKIYFRYKNKQRHSQLLIDHATVSLVSGFGSDVAGATATPLSATASKKRSMTAFPRRRFDSEICSLGKCA
jgi:hypothetical protein